MTHEKPPVVENIVSPPEQAPLGARIDVREQRIVEAEALRSVSPELFEGKLPAELQTRFDQAFGADADYALGINQSIDEGDIEATAQKLAEQGGVPVDYEDFSSQFLIFDSSDADMYAESSLTGYFGPSLGRNVVVFPSLKHENRSPGQIARDMGSGRNALPGDLLVRRHATDGLVSDAVNPKYLAGFIDAGVFHPNTSFLTEEAPRFAAEQGEIENDIHIGGVVLSKLVRVPSQDVTPEALPTGPFIAADAEDLDDTWM